MPFAENKPIFSKPSKLIKNNEVLNDVILMFKEKKTNRFCYISENSINCIVGKQPTDTKNAFINI